MIAALTSNLRKNGRFLLVGLLLALLILAAFWRVNYADFVNFDDPVYVTENAHVQAGLNASGVGWAFTTASAEFWHPLTWLSLMLDYELYGLQPGGYHLTNLLLHILSTLLLFWLLHRMTGTLWRSALVAALFALHPLHVESVAWIAERKDTLSTLFWMLALAAYVRYTAQPTARRYLLALLCFTCGLMSKPMLVTLPFVMLLLDYWPLQRLFAPPVPVVKPAITPGGGDPKPRDRKARDRKAGDREGGAAASKTAPLSKPSPQVSTLAARPPEKGWPGLLAEKIPFFLLALVFSGIALYTQYQAPFKIFPLSARIANALISYAVYIEKTFWPRDLAVFYPFPVHFPLWELAAAVLLLLIVSLAVIAAARPLPYLMVGWCWYLVTLLPVIGIVQVGKHARADRYTYLPLIGLFIMAAWGIPELLKKWRYQGPALLLSAALILSGLSVGTWRQVAYWQDSITLFRHALSVTTDNDVAHNNLGTALRKNGNIEEATSQYREVLRINPDDGEAHNNLGNALYLRGEVREAETHLREALRIRPQSAEVHYNLGNVLLSQGRTDEAVSQLRAALLSNPDYGEAYFDLANVLASQGKFSEAIANFGEVLRLNPNDEKAHNNIGRALLIEGRIDEAIAHFQAALSIQPDLQFAQDNLRDALELRAAKNRK